MSDAPPELTGDVKGTSRGSIKQMLVETKEQWAREGRSYHSDCDPLKEECYG
ncbi:MAG: hypothetical protein JKY27_06680 [Magnetovibrio sp.]|nr:hypothetical protein [Magnetovibrio sp.]